MKHSAWITVVVFATILLLPSELFAGSDYFWAGDHKVNITTDSSVLVLVFKQDKSHKNVSSTYAKVADISEATISGDQRMVVLVFREAKRKSKAEFLNILGLEEGDLEWYSFGYNENNATPLRPTNRISFKLKASFSEQALQPLMLGKATFDRTHFGTLMIKASGLDVDVVSLANDIYETGIVEYCLPDFIANIAHFEDPLYPDQYFLNHTGQFGGAYDVDIEAQEAWEVSTGSSTIKVAVIDNGIDAHNDLNDGSGNSRIVGGYTPHGGGNGSPSSTAAYHGEACAGIVAASHNNINVRGVAPNVKLLTVNIFAPLTTNNEVADGINWAWQNGADVLSNSWGYTCNASGFTWPTITDAITNARTQGRNGKGCVVVFGAGNNYPTDECGYGPPGYVGFPSNVSGVLCVSATNRNGDISSYSSRGSRIDITALGGETGSDADIRTLDRMGANGRNSGDDMTNFNGTSAACPQVAGVAALVISVNQNLTEQQVRDLITLNATDMGASGRDDLFGWGRVNAVKSVANAYALANPGNAFTVGTAPLTLYQPQINMIFLVPPRPEVAAGGYRCDRHIVDVTAGDFVNAPQGWYTAPYGFSFANPNSATRYLLREQGSNSVHLRTAFYFIRYHLETGEQINLWAPFDPSATTIREYATLGIPATAPVNPPTGLSGSPQSINQVQLTWQDNSNNEIGFKIERATDGLNFTQVGELLTGGTGTGTRTYTDGGLQQNVTYYYRVRSFAQGYISQESNTAQVIIPVLSAPQNVAATGHPYHVYLTWSTVSAATAYRVFRSISVGGPYNQVADVTTNSHWDQVPTAPQTYYYFIKARAGEYEGPQSTTVTALALHLQSTSATATAPNMQRKIIRDAAGNYHMVYASANEIWYCRSTDGGATWSAEKKLSDASTLPSGASRSASITFQANPDILLVVWETNFVDAGTSITAVSYCTIDPATGTPSSVSDLWINFPGFFTPSPVVASGYVYNSTNTFGIIVVWYDVDGQNRSLKCMVRRASDGQWFGATTLRSGTLLPLSIAPITVGTSYDSSWSLVWVEAGNLYFGAIRMSETPSFKFTEVIAYGDAEIQSIRNPSVASITSGTRGRGVTWEEYDPAYQRTVIKYSERMKNPPWSTPTVWASNPKTPTWYYTPSITGHYSSPSVALVWRSDVSQLRYVRRDTYTWTSQGNLATGVDPATSLGWISSTTEKVLSRSTASIYTIQQNTITYAGTQPMLAAGGASQQVSVMTGGPLSPTGSSEGRSGTVRMSDARLRLAVLAPSLNGEPISFPAISDTPQVIDERTFENALRSDAFADSGTLNLFLLYSGSGRLQANARMNLVLLDARSDQLLTTLSTLGGVRDTMIELNLPLDYPGRSLRLAVRARGFSRPTRFELERWMLSDEAGSSVMNNPTAIEISDQRGSLMPKEYALEQNYPNPFNPETIIRYQLPEATYVVIKLYDVLGREATTLADEQKPAGYYEVTLDASTLASGVYFYKMIAGEYVGIRKLVVIK